MKDFSNIHEGCLIVIFDRYGGSHKLGIVTSCGINDYHKECQVELNDEYKKSI